MSFFYEILNDGTPYRRKKLRVKRLILTIAAALFMLITLLCSFAIIPSGYRCENDFLDRSIQWQFQWVYCKDPICAEHQASTTSSRKYPIRIKFGARVQSAQSFMPRA